MPTFDFRNHDTKEDFEAFMSLTEKDHFLASNPHITQVIKAVKIVIGVGTRIKVDDGYREQIARIKQGYKINNISDH